MPLSRSCAYNEKDIVIEPDVMDIEMKIGNSTILMFPYVCMLSCMMCMQGCENSGQDSTEEPDPDCGIVERDFCLYVNRLSYAEMVEAEAWFPAEIDERITGEYYERSRLEAEPGQYLSDTESGRALLEYLETQMEGPAGLAREELLDMGVMIMEQYSTMPAFHIQFPASRLWDLAHARTLDAVFGIDFRGTIVLT